MARLTTTIALGLALGLFAPHPTAHAQMPPGFAPAPAPQTGDTAGCPSVAALGAQQGKFARSGAAGYYLIDSRGGVAQIDPKSLTSKLNALTKLDPITRSNSTKPTPR
jgi:hypothetical protein